MRPLEVPWLRTAAAAAALLALSGCYYYPGAYSYYPSTYPAAGYATYPAYPGYRYAYPTYPAGTYAYPAHPAYRPYYGYGGYYGGYDGHYPNYGPNGAWMP